MVKQRVVLCLDNTEFMRNGDYAPTRFAAQQKTAEHLVGKIVRSHPESLCSIMTMSNPTIEKSLSSNRQALQATLTQVSIRGESIDMIKSLKIAQLALKKRGEESTGEKRVILFVASPIGHKREDLMKVAKIYRRYNISVDIINFGELAANQEILESFVSEVDSDNSSHIVNVPQGPHLLSDMVQSSEILSEPGQTSAPSAAEGGDYSAMEDEDPQYAMALQLSLQEFEREQQRQQQQSGGSAQTEKSESTPQQSTSAPQQQESSAPETTQDDDVDMDEDEMMRQALEMSRQEYQQQQQQETSKKEDDKQQPKEQQQSEEEMVDEEDDEELQAALAMSMQQSASQKQDNGETIDDIMEDEEFLQNVVSNVTKDSSKKGDDSKKDDSKK